MEQLKVFFEQNWMSFIIFISIVIAGLIIGKVVFHRSTSLAMSSKTKLDDLFISSIKKPYVFWLIILAVYFSLRFSNLPVKIFDFTSKVLFVLAIISITVFIANLISGFWRIYTSKSGDNVTRSSLTINIIRGVIFLIGILVILGSLGIEITPILATLGIGGLAVALALQPTLSNLFAGFYVTASKQMKIGDYVKLDTGQEGYLTDIHWRTTSIRMLSNNMVLIPNEKLASAIVTNYYLPEKEMSVLINVGVHYDSDLVKVEQITIDVAKKTMNEVTGGVPEFEPFIRYNTFGDFSIGLTVILRAKQFVDQYLLTHEFIKALHKRYKAEGIIIPYPIHAVNYSQENKFSSN